MPTSANFDWFSLVKEGGAYCALLLFGAVIWLNKERSRLVDELKAKDEKLEALSERLITVSTKLGDLFNERRGKR